MNSASKAANRPGVNQPSAAFPGAAFSGAGEVIAVNVSYLNLNPRKKCRSPQACFCVTSLMND
jgi:hypothetical protein